MGFTGAVIVGCIIILGSTKCIILAMVEILSSTPCNNPPTAFWANPPTTRLASGAISGASKGARRAGAKPPVCTILCFCFKDTFLSATFLNLCRYLVNLAFSLGFNVTLPLRMFKAHSDRHWRRSLSAPCKIALHTWGWALAKARRRGACRFTQDVIPMCTLRRLNIQWSLILSPSLIYLPHRLPVDHWGKYDFVTSSLLEWSVSNQLQDIHEAFVSPVQRLDERNGFFPDTSAWLNEQYGIHLSDF